MTEIYVPITIESLNEDVDIKDLEDHLPVKNQAVRFKAKVLEHLHVLTPDKANIVSICKLSNGGFFLLPRNMRYYDLKAPNYKNEVLAETIGLISSLLALSDLIYELDKKKEDIDSLIAFYYKVHSYAVIDYRFCYEVAQVIDGPEILAAKICG